MILSLIFGLAGIPFLCLGWQIRKKEKIGLIQEYHRNRVSEMDKKAFCALCGAGVGIIGLGMLVTAVLCGFTEELWSISGFAAGFVLGLGILIFAISKYNR